MKLWTRLQWDPFLTHVVLIQKRLSILHAYYLQCIFESLALASALQSMEEESSKFGLHISLTKTKVQNLGTGPDAQDLVVNGHTPLMEWANSFISVVNNPVMWTLLWCASNVSPLLPVLWMYGDDAVLVYTQNCASILPVLWLFYFMALRHGHSTNATYVG